MNQRVTARSKYVFGVRVRDVCMCPYYRGAQLTLFEPVRLSKWTTSLPVALSSSVTLCCLMWWRCREANSH